MKSKQEKIECDNCGEKKIAESTMYFGGHPFNGWFTVNKRNATSCVMMMDRKTEFDFCSEKCLKEYDYVKGGERRRLWTITLKKYKRLKKSPMTTD